MAEGATESELHLEYCPRCGYSLNGLPSEGHCPECGRAYDQSFLVVYGWGERLWNCTPRRFMRLLAVFVGLVIFVSWEYFTRNNNWVIAGIAAVAGIFAVFAGIQPRFVLGHPGPVQFRVSANGFLLIEDLTRGPTLRPVYWLVFYAGAAVVIAAAMAMSYAKLSDRVFDVFVALVIISSSFVPRRWVRLRDVEDSPRGAAFESWDRISDLLWREMVDVPYRVRIVYRNRKKSKREVYVYLDCTPARAEELQRQIAAWRKTAGSVAV